MAREGGDFPISWTCHIFLIKFCARPRLLGRNLSMMQNFEVDFGSETRVLGSFFRKTVNFSSVSGKILILAINREDFFSGKHLFRWCSLHLKRSKLLRQRLHVTGFVWNRYETGVDKIKYFGMDKPYVYMGPGGFGTDRLCYLAPMGPLMS